VVKVEQGLQGEEENKIIYLTMWLVPNNNAEKRHISTDSVYKWEQQRRILKG
jgi:hypothetical protein